MATPLLMPYPSGEDEYGIADYLVQEYKLHYAFMSVIYGLRTLEMLGFDRLDIPGHIGPSSDLFYYIGIGIYHTIESDAFKDVLEILAEQDEELNEGAKFFMAEAAWWLAYLLETDLSRFDRDECLYEEAVKILNGSADNNIKLTIYGLELMQKSYLIEKIDPLVILECQESYLREHMKAKVAD